ncbi:MAG: recombination mediator RecR [Bacteroidetes bacterium]|nr:recombination mediator RecR [Bacteroidota bacterium]
MVNAYSSRLLENAVNEISRLPGIGRKTALRLALFLLRLEESEVESFSDAIIRMRREIRFCSRCHSISDDEICEICQDDRRDKSLLCIVEDIRDVMAIEATQHYKGLYHVLNGIISPMEGVRPENLTLESLFTRVPAENIREVILALPTTLEGDTTNFYIYRKLQNSGVVISVIARGIAIGDELEYTDEVTLGRSIDNRTPFKEPGTANKKSI